MKNPDLFQGEKILTTNKDETIGNVNVFKPSDERIGITPEKTNSENDDDQR